MKKIILIPIILTASLTAFMTLSLAAQSPTPPKPIDNELYKWFVGEWEGWYDGLMGKTKEVMRCKMGLNGQFLLLEARHTTKGLDYKSMGAATIDPKTGTHIGYVIDNFRSRYYGTGIQEGMKVTFTWTGSGNQANTIRSYEKVGENKMKSIIKATGYDGKPITVKIMLTRKIEKNSSE